MKTLLIALSLSFASMAVSATTFTSLNYKLTSTIAANTTDSTRPDTYGIGRIDSISDIDGGVLWTAGTDVQFINFNFQNYVTESVSGSSFEASGGNVNFWLNASDLFDTDTSWTSTVAAQSSGLLGLTTEGSGPTVGLDTGSNWIAAGFLDVTGGAAAGLLDTNSILNLLAEEADMSFNVGATSFVSDFYTYYGSSDSQGVATVPTPGAIWLLLTGFISLIVTKRNNVTFA